MGYSDPKYYSEIVVTLPVVGTGVYTSIASNAAATNAGLGGGKAFEARVAMNLVGGSVLITTAPSTTFQPCLLALMDGTATLGTATITTLTAGALAQFVPVAANACAATDTLTLNEVVKATASTASGSKTCACDVELIFNRAFV